MEEDLVVQVVLDKHLGQSLNKKQKPLSIAEELYCQEFATRVTEGLRSQTEASEFNPEARRGLEGTTPLPRPGVRRRLRFEGGVR